MFMAEVQIIKNFQAKIPIALWRQWEDWLKDRGALNNTQIFSGLLRLFLSSPEELQLKALFGRQEDLSKTVAGVLSDKECEAVRTAMRQTQEAASKVDAIRAILHKMSPQARQSLPREIIELMPPDEEARLAEFRHTVGTKEKEPPHRKRKNA